MCSSLSCWMGKVCFSSRLFGLIRIILGIEGSEKFSFFKTKTYIQLKHHHKWCLDAEHPHCMLFFSNIDRYVLVYVIFISFLFNKTFRIHTNSNANKHIYADPKKAARENKNILILCMHMVHAASSHCLFGSYQKFH